MRCDGLAYAIAICRAFLGMTICFLNLCSLVVREGHRNLAITRCVGNGPVTVGAGVRLGHLAHRHHGLQLAHPRLHLVLINRLPYFARAPVQCEYAAVFCLCTLTLPISRSAL